MATTGHGSTYTFSGITEALLSFEWTGLTCNPIETSHLGTSSEKTFAAADYVDLGEVTLTVQHAAGPPTIGGAAGTLVLDIKKAGASRATFTFTSQAICIAYDIDSGDAEGIVTATVRFKLTGVAAA